MKKKSTSFDRHMMYIILAYAVVQFGEALIWYSNVKKNNINKTGTALVYIGLAIQSFAAGYADYITTGRTSMLILGSTLSAYFIMKMNTTWSTIGKNGYLDWQFDSGFYNYIFAMAVFIILNWNVQKKQALITIMWFLFGYSFVYYKHDDTPSVWCYLSSLFTPALYFVS